MSETLKQIEAKIAGSEDVADANKWLQTRKELLAQEQTRRQARLRAWLTCLAAATVALAIILWLIKKLFVDGGLKP